MAEHSGEYSDASTSLSDSFQQMGARSLGDEFNTIGTCTESTSTGRDRNRRDFSISTVSSAGKSMVGEDDTESQSAFLSPQNSQNTKTLSRSGLLDFVPPDHAHERVASRAESEMSMASLRFDRLDFFGREEEKKILKRIVKRVVAVQQETAPLEESDDNVMKTGNELILISGRSGVGKSTMAKFMSNATKRVNGLFIVGKFDMNMKRHFASNSGTAVKFPDVSPEHEPYSGIKNACLQICGELLYLKTHDSERSTAINSEIIKALGSELGLLNDLVPELQDVLSGEAEQEILSAEWTPSRVTQSSTTMLHNTFRRFIRCIASNFAPLVMTLDDLHRADGDSLELVEALLSDSENSGLIVVGTFRSEEVDEAHILDGFIKRVKAMSTTKDSPLSHVTDMFLDNFSEDQVKHILMVLLNMDDQEKIAKLASICHKRTLGNMFHLDCFMRKLRRDGLLQFSFRTFSWEWDDAAILSLSSAEENVVDLVTNRLLEVPESIRRRLAFAACLGSSFDTDTEQLSWSNAAGFGEDGQSASDDAWLEVSEKSGILESINSNQYRWAHDQVQEAAFSLLSKEELPSIETRIGRALLENLPGSKKEAYFYTIVNLLNSGEPVIGRDAKLEMAELNRKATRKASDQVGLESMSRYADIGIQNLPEDAWQSHYELALDLHSYAVEAANILGMEERLNKHATTILEQVDRPIADKVRAYKALIAHNTKRGDPSYAHEALRICLDALSQLGVQLPRSKGAQVFSTLKLLLKIRKKVLLVEDNHVLRSSQAVDPLEVEAMSFFSICMDTVYIADPDLLGLWILMFAELALKNGTCEYTQSAFAQLGIVFLIMNDFARAEKCGRLAEKLMKGFNYKSQHGNTAYQIYGFSLPYIRPYRKNIPGLLGGYASSLALGQVNGVCTNIVFYCYMSFASGFSLDSVEADCRRYSAMIDEFGSVQQAVTNINTLWQCVLNLLGRSDDPYVLSGEAIPDFDAFRTSTTIKSGQALIYFAQVTLYAILGDFEAGSSLSLANEGFFKKAGPGMFLNIAETCARGLCYFGMARKSKKKKYRRAGMKVLSCVRAWAKQKNPNVTHFLHLFEAELFALDGKPAKAELHYHKAVALARRAGFVQDAAIINERLAAFFWRDKNSPDDAIYHMEKACELYEEWGCQLKADILRREYEQQSKAHLQFPMLFEHPELLRFLFQSEWFTKELVGEQDVPIEFKSGIGTVTKVPRNGSSMSEYKLRRRCVY
eukprot:CAMPEP_0172473570 /NCGR_PEP_ID=MMETSP1065-20121228/68923_1 /TAXON_ID=265537 /ORGANISM="Amphiprora paludosa, Strain CCMP125" /LENGTH=1236 /DNA_ID=CAMNT_0013231745 /DNA_START=115 /DNA_END=3826 /DNA_ORIENTATION=-